VTSPRRWVLASDNRAKAAELEALLDESRLPITLVTQKQLGIESAPETGATFIENALLKARHAARLSGLPAIADDSGLAVAALAGRPGIHSARFAGANADDWTNVAKLLALLREVPAEDRGARFHCVLVALEHAEDPAPLIATGEWTGVITAAPAGTQGFGYDPVFLDPSLGKTAAELTASEKSRVSHRGMALRRLAELLTKS
jgi:XTP/dITP diphosphohydrolase